MHLLSFFFPLICGLASGFAWNLIYRLVRASLNHCRLPKAITLLVLLSVYIGLLFVPCLRDFVLIASASGAIAAIFAKHWSD
jgi:xanthosine utilization system XapX-like protein